jgi:hypothetical protein
MLPPRPPRASSDLPPPVPKKLINKDIPKGGSNNIMHRNGKVPDQQLLKKVLLLQIQSPSMMKTFQKASSTEDLQSRSTSSRFSNASKTLSKKKQIKSIISQEIKFIIN